MTVTDEVLATRPSPARRGGGVGLLAMLGSSASFALSGPLGSGLQEAGWSPVATVTFRVGIAALVLALPAWWAVRGDVGRIVREWRTVVTYGVFAICLAQLCFFVALTRLTVGVALLVEFLAPVVLVGWAWARRGHRPRRAGSSCTRAAG